MFNLKPIVWENLFYFMKLGNMERNKMIYIFIKIWKYINTITANDGNYWSGAFAVTKFNEVFLGYQLCQVSA